MAKHSPLEDPLQTHTTPATGYTGELCISVDFASDPNRAGRYPVVGTTTYLASELCGERMSEFGSYICTKVDGSGKFHRAWFGKPKTAVEADTPFKTPEEDMGNHYWPPILKAVEITRNKVPKTANTGDNIYSGFTYSAVPIFVPNADTGTLFVLREMLSPVKFNIPQWPTPITGAVHFPLPNSSPFSFPECLHDDIVIGGLQDLEQIVDTVGLAVTNRVGLVNNRNFPATNFKTWLPYILYDRQTQLATGLYHRRQMEVVPPPLPLTQRG